MSSRLLCLFCCCRTVVFFDIVVSHQLAPGKPSGNSDSSRSNMKESTRESKCSDFAPDDPKFHHIGVMLTNSLMKTVNVEDESNVKSTKATAVPVDKENDNGTTFDKGCKEIDSDQFRSDPTNTNHSIVPSTAAANMGDATANAAAPAKGTEETTTSEVEKENGANKKTNARYRLPKRIVQALEVIKTAAAAPVVAFARVGFSTREASPEIIYNFFVEEKEPLEDGKRLLYQLVKVVVDGPTERMGQWEETNCYYVQEDPLTDPFFMLFQVDKSGAFSCRPHDGHPDDHDAVLYWKATAPGTAPAMIDLDLEKAFRILDTNDERPDPPPTPVWFHEIVGERA